MSKQPTILQSQIATTFQQTFRNRPQFYVKAPGRINLIGEHTDYNMGFVLPAAIDKHILFGFAANETEDTCRLRALDMSDSYECSLKNIQKTEYSWVNYLLGVVQQIQKRNIEIKGFDCVFAGNIPIGSGLSSSAALECGFARGLCELAGVTLEKWEIARIGNQTENQFLGIQSGILDQFSSTFGQKDKVMLMDCRSQTFEYLPLELGDYCLVLINSNVKHEHTTSGYNDRPTECKQAVRLLQNDFPEIESLRDVTFPMLKKYASKLPPILLKRCQFILAENERVHQFCEHLKTGQVLSLGDLLYQSHHGLQHLYEVSCTELDLLVDLTRNIPEILGARMMGGGFGGCTLNLIKRESAKAVTSQILAQYRIETGIAAEIYFVEIENGVDLSR
ncbi:MAG: galactokinase [Chitinophagales bacterium]